MKELLEFGKRYREHWKLLLFTLILAITLGGLDLAFPKIIQIIIDDILPGRKMKLFYMIASGLVLMYIVRFLISYAQLYMGNILGIKIETEMRSELFGHIQKLPFNYFDNNKTGIIMSKLVNDLSGISELANHGPIDLVIAIIRLFGAFFLMAYLSLKLTCVIFAVIPFMIWFSVTQKYKMKLRFRETRRKIADINGQVGESIGGVRVVKSFTNEGYEVEKFEELNKRYQGAKKETYKTSATFFSGLHLYMNTMQFIVVFYGGYLILKGEVTYGILISFLLYSYRFMEPIRKMMILVQSYQKGMAGYRRFKDMMKIKTEDYCEDEKVTLKRNMENGLGIEFKNVDFSYIKERKIIKDFNIKIEPGEKIALVGSSGSGKTTIGKLISNFYKIDNGEILIDKYQIEKISLLSLRREVGVVPQEPFLFEGTIFENISYGKLDATREEVVKASKDADIYEFIMSLPNGLDTKVGERGVKLSGGEKQRISIARAFLRDPKILILDEATASLDSITEKKIQKALEKLSKNRTTITIAHRLSTIVNSDRIVVMEKGRIIEMGTHKELIEKKGKYYILGGIDEK